MCKTFFGRLTQFQSTRSARSATTGITSANFGFVISIHALREERDRVRDPLGLWHWNFNPRAPRGARHDLLRWWLYDLVFQSTRSARSATWR